MMNPVGPLNENFKFFMANLPFEISPEEVNQFFRQFGEVNLVKIITDKFTLKSKGYGFLYMLTAHGDAAVESYAASNSYRIQLGSQKRVFLTRHDQKRELPQRNPSSSHNRDTSQLAPAAGYNGPNAQQSQQQQHNNNNHNSASPSYNNPNHNLNHPPAANQNAPLRPDQLARGGGYHHQNSHYQQQHPQPPSLGVVGAAPVPYDPKSAPYLQPTVTVPQTQHQAQVSAPIRAISTSYAPPPTQYVGPYGLGPTTTTAPAPAYGHEYSNQQQQYVSTSNHSVAPNPAPYQATVHQQQPTTQSQYAHPQQPIPPAASTYSYHQPPINAAPSNVSLQQPPMQQQHLSPPPPPPPHQRNNIKNILLENLPITVRPNQIVDFLLLEHQMTVRRCNMEYDPNPKASWCYAHVEFASPQEANNCLDLAQRSSLTFQGRILQASLDGMTAGTSGPSIHNNNNHHNNNNIGAPPSMPSAPWQGREQNNVPASITHGNNHTHAPPRQQHHQNAPGDFRSTQNHDRNHNHNGAGRGAGRPNDRIQEGGRFNNRNRREGRRNQPY